MQEVTYLEPLLHKFFADKMSGVFSCMVGRVENIQNLKEGRIDVKPLHMPNMSSDGDYYELPLVKNALVLSPNSKESGLMVPVKQGDTVLLLFADHNLDLFKSGSTNPYYTRFERRSDINDAIAIIGISPFIATNYNPENHKNQYDVEDVSLFNNLNTERENNINLKQNGDINHVGNSHNFEGDIIANDDIIIGGISLKQFMKAHTHGYTDDGSPMITAPPNPL